MPDVDARLPSLRAALGGRLYVGRTTAGLALTPPEHAALVLGPPRSGKSSGLVVPNVLAAPGPVVSTSTKPDVLAATLAVRRRLGRCWLLDPTGTVATPEGVTALRWSPVVAARSWDEALVVTRALTGAARPDSRGGEALHWTERAEALVAPLLHAAALAGLDMRQVVTWVLTHDLTTPRATLSGHRAALGAAVLDGLDKSDQREMSGIWSTAASVLAAYRSEAVLASAGEPNFDPAGFSAGRDTVYICAPAERQELVAPIVVAFLAALRSEAYARDAAGAARPGPLLLALDEVANIAPLPDLPATVSEAGSQGVTVLACLQDLSQARHRWGARADGLLTLFGTKVVLGGVADQATLELVSRLGGEVDVPRPAASRGTWWHPSTTESWSLHRQRRLPVDAIRELPAGQAVVLAGADPPARVGVDGWWRVAPFAPVPSYRRPDPPGTRLPVPGSDRHL